jgi:hypothetical protein
MSVRMTKKMALNESHSFSRELFNLHWLPSFAAFFTALEAPGGFEPPHKGFADLSLTTWVRRQIIAKCGLSISDWEIEIRNHWTPSKHKKRPRCLVGVRGNGASS